MATSQDEPTPGDELLPLLGKLVDGTAGPDDLARLNDRLASDPEARRMYRSYLNLHVALRACHAAPADDSSAGEGSTGDERAAPLSAPAPFGLRRGRRSLPFGWLLAVCLASASTLLVVLAWDGTLGGKARNVPQTSGNAIARVTKAAHAHLAGTSSAATPDPVTVETPIEPGLFNLLDGFVELTFANGANVVLEAPVELEIVGPMQAVLRRGRMVAHVPPQARGFAIQTPRARVVDLGTEFGVGVEASGNTEVQVFVGEVVAEWKNLQGKTVDRHLTAGGAVLLEAQEPPRGIPFQPEQFVRMFPADHENIEPGGPMYNRSRFETVHVLPAPKKIAIDGDLSDWDQRRAFRSACFPPYHDSHYVEGLMMYDDQFLYIGAHVGDPAPLQSRVDPQLDPRQFPWRGGSVIVRLCVDPKLGWPLSALGRAEADPQHPEIGRRPEDVNEKIVHLTMWCPLPANQPRLQLSFGMDFHGEQVDPPGWQGAFRKDPNGLGYTLEYAIPWSLLNAADRPPQAGDVLAANWTVHWSDNEGKLSRGHLVEITNLEVQPYRFLRAKCWGKAVFHGRDDFLPNPTTP